MHKAIPNHRLDNELGSQQGRTYAVARSPTHTNLAATSEETTEKSGNNCLGSPAQDKGKISPVNE